MERAAKAEQGKSKVTGPSESEGWVGGRPTPPNFGRSSRWNTFFYQQTLGYYFPPPKIFRPSDGPAKQETDCFVCTIAT